MSRKPKTHHRRAAWIAVSTLLFCAPCLMAQVNSKQIAMLHWYAGNTSVSFATGSYPHGITFDGANMWVANRFGNSMSKIRASDGATLGTYAVGLYPYFSAFDGANIWVANTGSTGSLTKLRARDGALLGTYNLGSPPYGIAFDGSNIWVTFSSSGLGKFDLNGNLIVSYSTCSNPRGIAFGGASLWVTCSMSSQVEMVRPSDGNSSLISVGTSPGTVVFDGTYVWVGNFGSSTLTKINAGNGAVVATISGIGTNPAGLSFDGTNLWVSSYQQLARVRPTDGAVLNTFTVPQSYGLAFDGADIWITNEMASTVSKF